MKKHFLAAVMVLLAMPLMQGWLPGNAEEQKVVSDLKVTFTGETTAAAKYMAYAEKAKAEGLPKIALLFEAVAKSETIHAGNHNASLVQLDERAPSVMPEYSVKSTKENLEDAIKGESYEISSMYPGFIEDANAAKVALAQISFNYAYKTELKHKALFENALSVLQNGGETSLPSAYRVCATCGNTYAGAGPARCGFCITGSDRYIAVNL